MFNDENEYMFMRHQICMVVCMCMLARILLQGPVYVNCQQYPPASTLSNVIKADRVPLATVKKALPAHQ